MSTLLDDVRHEIVDIHEFLVAWFNGTIDRDQLEPRLLSRFDPDVVFIPPEGHVVGGAGLQGMFERGYGTNKDFKIQIRDVTIRRQIDRVVLANYTEWQIGATTSHPSNNARVTSAMIDMGPPLKWLHIHETWLPEEVRAAGSFDF
ncbi:hypothetical protein Q5Y75_24545 [Ruegeria sp. 2205SS24-7]|uniref:hypothetical protein n=1 Tax=Ruegeria discodermiae TaxID=3064389 RepID=UPI0027416BDF|nr:hypothetical protein [Ruegeria sp. 2205SS24-7]MDP5220362.1 hypothetical protein [Ruegeria sp. 2205SS24-7]